MADDDDDVQVVDKLPMVAVSKTVFLRYDPNDGTGGSYWRWTSEGWEPAVPGTHVPRRRVE